MNWFELSIDTFQSSSITDFIVNIYKQKFIKKIFQPHPSLFHLLMTNAACQTVNWCNHSKAKSVCTKTTQAKIAIRKMGMQDMPTDRTNQSGKEKNIYMYMQNLQFILLSKREDFLL